MCKISTLTPKQRDKISSNLRAFVANFSSIRIEREDYGKGFYVFVPADAEYYVQYCYNIDYLDGWLYGCVQGLNRKDMLPKRGEN